jgi:suppressor of G2 allele of SKP1
MLAVSTKYQYYQSGEAVTLTVLAKQCKPEDVDVHIAAEHISVFIRWPADGAGGLPVVEHVLDKDLFAAVVVDASTVSVRPAKIEIVLRKAVVGETWPSLDHTGPKRVTVRPAQAASVVASASSASSDSDKASTVTGYKIPPPYATRRNWDAVGKDIEQELESEKPEGEEALQKLFRDIYTKAGESLTRQSRLAM